MAQRLQQLVGFGFILILLITLSGCGANSNPQEKALQYIEKAANQESGFEKQQKPLIAEEQKEHNLYRKIQALDIKHFNEIQKNSETALQSIKKRKQMIDAEKKSIDQADGTFKEAIPYINKIKDASAQKVGQKLITDMDHRYKAFQALYTAYTNSITEDQKLFKMLETKSMTQEELQAQLVRVNDMYTIINKTKDTFNKDTTQFNQDKKAFYASFNSSEKHSG